jgi:hypothetical protein
MLVVRTFDRLNRVAEYLPGPFDQLAGLTAVDEHLGDGVESPEQPHQHGSHCHPVLDAGRVHDHGESVALRIDRDAPLAPFDLLARIVTAPPPFSAVLAG